MSIYGAALRELEQYRRDEAAGLLLRLPVPLGATVWRVRDNPACHYGVREAEKFLFGRVVTPRRIVEPTPLPWLCWTPGERQYSPPRLRGGRC